MAAQKGMLGHGGIVVFDDSVDMAQQARFAFCKRAETLAAAIERLNRLRPR